MDVYTAKVQLTKLQTYVRDLVSSNPRMYAKSKQRWKEISLICANIIETLSIILEDEYLDSGDEGFESRSVDTGEIIEMVHTVEHAIGRLNQVLKVSPVVHSYDSTECKQIFQLYQSVFAAPSTFGSDNVSKCFENICLWFKVRFLSPDSTFKYNIDLIRDWVGGIVLAFGYYLEHNQLDDFFQDQLIWRSDVTAGHNSYPVSKLINSFVSSESSVHYTLTAVLLWDILSDKYLSPLVVADGCKPYLDRYQLYDRCNRYNPTALDKYVNYAQHPEILVSFSLGGMSC